MTEDYVCNLPQDVQQYAKEVLNETEQNRKKGFTKIKEWAANNPDLNVRTEDKYILPFLRTCKFDVKKTKEKMKNYYLMKRDMKEWYHQNRDSKSLDAQDLIKMGSYLILERTSKKGLIAITRGTAYDPNKLHLDTLLKIGVMIASVVLFEDELSQIYGVEVIVDLGNMKLGHVRQLSVGIIRSAVHILQNFHGRPQQVLFVNFPKFLHVFLSIFKTFLPEKISNRVSSKSDGDLTCLFNKDIVPPEYGGIGETIEEITKKYLGKMTEYVEWFMDDEKYQAK